MRYHLIQMQMGFRQQGASSMTLIKTLTASNDANVDFEHGSSSVVLDSTYPVYLFKFINLHPVTNEVYFSFQANGAGETGFNESITSTAFRTFHFEDANNAGLGYRTAWDQANGTSYQRVGELIGNQNDESLSGNLFLFNPSSTTFVKHFMSTVSLYYSADGAIQTNTAGYFNTTTAIDQVVFKMSSGNIDSGTIKLYGIKDS
jgi:hypothetical protein